MNAQIVIENLGIR